MPVFRVNAPDGTVIRVNAPDGATEAEAIQYAQQQYGGGGGGGAAAADRKTDDQAKAYAGGEDVGAMGAVMRGLGGAKHGLDRYAMGLKGLFTDLTDEDKALLAQGKAFQERSGIAGKVGEFGTDLAVTAPLGGLATQGLRAGTAAINTARSLPRTIAALTRGGGEVVAGAGLGALGAPEDREGGAREGAVGSALGLGLNRVAGGVVRPLMSAASRRLAAAGIRPTLGQGIGGWANRVEEQVGSIPFVGGAIRNARNRAGDEFNDVALRTAVPRSAGGVGDQAISAARDQISDQYTRALQQFPGRINVDLNAVAQTARNAMDDRQIGMSPAVRQRFAAYINQHMLGPGAGRDVPPEVLKGMESDLSAVIARYSGHGASAEDRAFADGLRQVQQEWRRSLTGIGNAVGGNAGDELRAADAAYRAFIPIDTAASRAGAQGAEEAGTYTPKALRRAIEASDKSMNNRSTRYGRGGNATPFDRLSNLTRDAEQTISDRIPDSGTAGRVGVASALGAGAGVSGGTAILPAVAGLAGSHAAYSRAGQTFLQEGLGPMVQALVDRGMAPQAAQQFIQQHGADAVMALLRSGATSTRESRE